MIKAAIEKIEQMSQAFTYTQPDGRMFSNKPLVPILPAKPEPILMYTLTGLRDYLMDGDIATKYMIHVVNHNRVDILDRDLLPCWLTRSLYARADYSNPVFGFGRFMDVESFIIAVQAMFVEDVNTALILRVAGNLKDEAVTNFSDDGVTQSVTARAGVSRVEQIVVPNPVTLRPYRTFMEIEQPASTFVFRMKSDKGNPPLCALFESDGKMWELDAIMKIRDWLLDSISPVIKVIA